MSHPLLVGDLSRSKTCTKCSESLPLTEFGIDRSAADGLRGRCRPCIRVDSKIWNLNNKEKKKQITADHYKKYKDKSIAYARQWSSANSEKVKASQRKYYHHNKRKFKEQVLKSTYGISVSDYELLLEKQNNRCAICDTDQGCTKNGYFHIDHDHKTGKVRGLLCNNCNLCLGYAKDNKDVLSAAIKYLEQNA